MSQPDTESHPDFLATLTWDPWTFNFTCRVGGFGNTWEILGTASGDMKKIWWKYSNYLEWRWEVEEVEVQWILKKLHDFLVPFTEFLKSTRVGFPTPNEGVLSIKDDLEAKIILKTWAWHTWDWTFKSGAILMSFGTCFEYLRECIHSIHPEIFT